MPQDHDRPDGTKGRRTGDVTAQERSSTATARVELNIVSHSKHTVSVVLDNLDDGVATRLAVAFDLYDEDRDAGLHMLRAQALTTTEKR